MRFSGTAVAVLATYVALSQGDPVQRHEDHLPRLAGAELLEEGYSPDRLILAGEHSTRTIQEGEVPLNPNISKDGNMIALVRRSSGSTLSATSRSVVSTYSLTDGRWTDHPRLKDALGPVAISPDASKLAAVTHDLRGALPRLCVLDLRTEELAIISQPGQEAGDGISWSPDGRFIAFDVIKGISPISVDRDIYVADMKTGVSSRIGSGMSPSWSPSGEWIAFIGLVLKGYQAGLMSPVGNQVKALMNFRSTVIPAVKPVWSPDSTTLLITKSRNADLDMFDVCVIDVKTGKLTKTFKRVAPVYGWVPTP